MTNYMKQNFNAIYIKFFEVERYYQVINTYNNN